MKKLYLILLVIMLSMCHAQAINIPDSYLKNKLLTYGTAIDAGGNYINLDANNDGEIQLTEASQVRKFNIYNLTDAITSLSGLNEFPNLYEIELTNPDINTFHLIFNNFPNLQRLKFFGGVTADVTIQNCNSLFSIYLGAHENVVSIQNTSVQEINLQAINAVNITSCPNINKFSLSVSSIGSLDLSNLPLLQEVNITDNTSLSNINFSGSTGLKKIVVAHNQLNSLTIPNPSIVNYLDIVGNTFQNFNLTPYTSLVSFFGVNNQLESLDFSNCSMVYEVNVMDNALHSIVFNNNANLQYLDIRNNQIEEASFNQTPWLKALAATNNSFKNVDLTQNLQLVGFDFTNNTDLKTLLIKNGRTNYSGLGLNLTFGNTPQLKYLCIDPMAIGGANALLTQQYNQPNVVVNSYCSFTPGGTYYTVQGSTRYDMNGNGCDSNDPIKPFQKFNVFSYTSAQGQGTSISNISGAHSFFLPFGTTVITPILENPAYFTITPATVNVNFPTQPSPATQDFCLTANGNHNDLEIVIIPVTIATPGFESKYKIVYKNKGTAAQSGNIAFSYNNSVMNYLTATTSPDTQSAGTLNWNFTNLLPFETREITVKVQLNTPTQIPALNSGDILSYTAKINGATDEVPADNYFGLNQKVVNSFDPNDKTCLEGASIAQSKVGDYVHYVIRFENTGTANARNIVVTDEIDTSKFDVSSLVALNGSHNFVTKIINPNAVEFIFENIQLPFDDANNDGYISFKIKTKSTLTAGDSFSNTAKIYFDYNHPIITNTATTTVENTLATTEVQSNKDQLTIYPNPVKDVLNIQSKNEVKKVEIYDAAGRIVLSTGVSQKSVDVSALPKGNYMIKIMTKNAISHLKFIKD
ncbi:T9SS C-terminal target domain-containing protein [Chryseobacterium lactis]|uniref:T9SS C-terminal target domain-containing protein n=1 Tax=Chryseobacterium lactis TaxID=1241981 RepID=A0A3G6RIE2_CHRLC|nr:T9SS type A sorting domain-containing protein [Chryseobacterium lactis]AZA82608.1 T9SS C-terminal target domain-containing protein [Chryseobacterium lactis]AZB02989.1 T9SS C-terminal target domain-containing protein [Chryseobacterium lactis]PNW11871.1 T9SS C-terminal target domain-containing protein [Chryseobacterium lactis]